jgi:cell division septation protein DedD
MTQPPPFGESRYQRDPDDTPTVPKLFAQGDVPAGFWDGPRPAGPQATPDPPVAQPMAVPPGPPPGAVDAGPPAEYEHPRRRAFIAVGLVALATVLVVGAALLIGPRLGSGQADDDQVAPPLTPSSTTSSPVTSAPSEDASSRPGIVPPTGASSAESVSSAGSDPTAASVPGTTSVVTVTVTAPSKPTATRSSTASTTAAPTTSTSKKKTPTTTTSASSSASPYGVPIQQISCSDGYIVQLASELTSDAFAARVAGLKKQGLVPADAKAADSTKSCRLFTNQTNTLILYAGPFEHAYDACPDRLAGPYDAFIRGANPGTSGEFVSCICPATVRSLPTFFTLGTTNQWVGELQHMLAAHLRYRIDDLGVGTWGQYTPDTRRAVRRFQVDNGLPNTGRVDARTWRALQRAGC